MAGTMNGLAPRPFEMLDDRPGDGGDIGDAPAAGGNGHALARPDFLAQVEPRKLGMDLARHVVDAGGVEGLAEAEDFRESGHIVNRVPAMQQIPHCVSQW